jgi:hypothetical protein
MLCPAPANTQPSDIIYKPLKYYRIRIEFETSADRAVIDIVPKGEIYSSWLLDLRGEPEKYVVRNNRLALTQSQSHSQAGNVVGLTADFPFSPQCSDKPFIVKLRESKEKSSTVRIYHINGNSADLLAEIDETSEISIDLEKVKDLILHEVQMPVTNLEKLVWAFYYPYYDVTSWNSKWLRDHPAVRYSSSDRKLIERHIDQAKSAGIDGFLVSWWGPNHRTDKNLRRILKIAEQKDFKIAIYFETLSNDRVRPVKEIYSFM